MGKRNPEVAGEFYRLQQNYSKVRDVMTGPAILAAWFLLGDEMWATPETKSSAATNETADGRGERG